MYLFKFNYFTYFSILIFFITFNLVIFFKILNFILVIEIENWACNYCFTTKNVMVFLQYLLLSTDCVD